MATDEYQHRLEKLEDQVSQIVASLQNVNRFVVEKDVEDALIHFLSSNSSTNWGSIPR